MKEYGNSQGDMSPTVDDYQKPLSAYSQQGFSGTTKYIERNDKIQSSEAKMIKKQDYKGRYS